MDRKDALTPSELAIRLDALGIPADAPLAAGLSGGADSTALVYLLKERRVTALIVDHGLRPESGREARFAADWCAGEGIAREILVWTGEKPAHGLQAAARMARYALLDDWCRVHGVRYLLTAHHLEDQAETVILRLARGSGADGLAAMAPDVSYGGPRRIRPLLDIPKARLKATLRKAGIGWIEDPANESADYQRVKVRKLLAETDIEGLTPSRLAATAARMRRAREALEWATENLLRQSVYLDSFGIVTFSVESLAEAPEEITLRALARILRSVTGSVYPPRLSGLEALWAAVRRRDFRGASLMGALVQPLASGIAVMREAAAIRSVPVQSGETVLFDNRFEVDVPAGLSGPLALAVLGEEGWRRVKSHAVLIPKPHAARLALPALWRGKELVAAPAIGFGTARSRFKPLFPLTSAC